ncbi:putative Heavy metal transport/detoxification superfamily protein [Tripterygium wilfordii]|uniref:Putative Heavy metal transport/detoxification superfamily protein n=1 Tax=Tripterygium wilfordii TaxID=458696 RepID=A0A7J7CTX2_TRIWF|nr:heavy metal-associated isoprenylated plant protein 5 [Tripterygium wilfordii]KAF5737530.1 putative Heavy metal transport/detoxification superfamily protein [Tripterygium wilfordii]
MGELFQSKFVRRMKEGAKNEGEKKPAAAAPAPAPAEKKDDDKVVLKIDMHCEGCARKIKRAVKHMDGVEDVKADTGANKLTVTGKVDPTKIKERLEEKTKKKVDIISPQPKKDAAPKPAEKSESKPAEKKAEEKKPPKESTVVLKIRLHCDGCIKKIKKTIVKIQGVDSVSVDNSKDLVTVKGTMDVNALVSYLKEKLKRPVEVVPAKKDDGAAEKKDKEAAGGDKKVKEVVGDEKKVKEVVGDEKKEKEKGGDDGKKEGGVAKVEVSKMEHFGYSQPGPSYWFDGHVYGQNYVADSYHQGYIAQGYVPPQSHVYEHPGYQQGSYMPMMEYHSQPPQMFSDENPNACSVM